MFPSNEEVLVHREFHARITAAAARVGNEDEYELGVPGRMSAQGTPGTILTKETDDPVRPNHYASLGKYSAVDVIEVWGLGFLTGNAIKYVQRAGKKPGEPETRDISKAIWYLQRRLHELDDSFPDPAES
jgi:Protein of unknwon function (DUF3310)